MPWRVSMSLKEHLASFDRTLIHQVGERYQLQKLLGHGSFSSVCMAIDTFTSDKVLSLSFPRCWCHR